MPIDWVFVTARPVPPAQSASHPGALGGTEQALMALTQALTEAGDRVRVLSGLTGAVAADRVVAVNDATLLPPGTARPFVWFHNEVEFLKETRRGRLPALVRHRPTAVFVGADQARRAAALLPFRRRVVIPHGLSAHILRAAPATAPPAAHAVFTSQAYRGLDQVLAMWRSHVAPAVPGARLTAFIDARDVPAFPPSPGITITGRIPNHAVPDMLRSARLWLAPGHRAETFCMAAAEAVAMGVPAVTLGIGALRDRVRHNVDGFICPDMAAMAARTAQLLTDDSLWTRLHQAGIATRTGQDWASAAASWRAL